MKILGLVIFFACIAALWFILNEGADLPVRMTGLMMIMSSAVMMMCKPQREAA